MEEAYAYATAAAALFGLSDALVRLASAGLTARANLAVSLLVGTPILALAAAAMGDPVPDTAALAAYAAAGLVNFVVGRLLFYISIESAGAVTASILASPTIIISSLLAHLTIGDPVTPGDWAGLGLVAAASYVSSTRPSGEPLRGRSALGVVAGAGSSLAFATAAVLVRWAGLRSGPTTWGTAVSYATALPAALVLGLSDLWGNARSRHTLIMVLAAAVVAGAQLSRYHALALTTVAQASAVIGTYTLFTAAFAVLLPGEAREKPGLRHLVAAALAASGVYVAVTH